MPDENLVQCFGCLAAVLLGALWHARVAEGYQHQFVTISLLIRSPRLQMCNVNLVYRGTWVSEALPDGFLDLSRVL
jgi:hypothetical protein